jgi:hypothetical protein
MRVNLHRIAHTPLGVFGELTVEGTQFSCYTVERPWIDNLPEVSCIPEGTYNLVPGRYNRGGYPAFEVRGVSGRSLIKIHRGNTMHDLRGCIAPGDALGCVGGVWAVLRSRSTLDALHKATGFEAGLLIITA